MVLTGSHPVHRGNGTYSLFLQNPREEPVYLSGYGVELAIKSTEYKAKDDTQVKGEFVV